MSFERGRWYREVVRVRIQESLRPLSRDRVNPHENVLITFDLCMDEAPPFPSG